MKRKRSKLGPAPPGKPILMGGRAGRPARYVSREEWEAEKQKFLNESASPPQLRHAATQAGSNAASPPERVRSTPQPPKKDVMNTPGRTTPPAPAARGAVARAASTPPIRVGFEPKIYRRGGEHSFIREAVSWHLGKIMGRGVHPDISWRIERHREEHAREAAKIQTQQRAASGTAQFSGLVVPQYLTDLAAPLAHPLRPVANICNQHDLPVDGQTLTISRITTGTSAGIQATEGGVMSSQAIDDTVLQVPVCTIGGFNDISLPAAMRGVGVDDVLVQDLTRAYHSELDRQILVADGTGGTLLGIANTAGIGAVSYADATPTVGEAWLKLADAKQRISAGLFQRATHWIMAPRRLGWFDGAVDSTGRPLVAPISYGVQAINQTAPSDGPASLGNSGAAMLRLPVVEDGNVPLTLGAGTEDEILAVDANELHLWEDPTMPLAMRFEQPVGHQGQLRIMVFGFVAFTAARYPSASSLITGSGLIAPVY